MPLRLIYRPSKHLYGWTHAAVMQPGDIDCTDMSDEEFEAFVREREQLHA